MVLDASKNLRVLFGDLNEILTIDKWNEKIPLQYEQFSGIRADLQNYLKDIMRDVIFRIPESLELICDHHTLKRSVYNMVRLIDKYIPQNVAIMIEADREQSGVVFEISVPGHFKECFEDAISNVGDSETKDARYDLLFVQYFQNFLYRNKAKLSIIEQGDRTGIRFLLPQPSPNEHVQV